MFVFSSLYSITIRAKCIFSVVGKITNLSTQGKFMVSFDAESLFTNRPLEESVYLAGNYIEEGNPNLKFNKSSLNNICVFQCSDPFCV